MRAPPVPCLALCYTGATPAFSMSPASHLMSCTRLAVVLILLAANSEATRRTLCGTTEDVTSSIIDNTDNDVPAKHLRSLQILRDGEAFGSLGTITSARANTDGNYLACTLKQPCNALGWQIKPSRGVQSLYGNV
jgi:hypothetical protein